MIHILCEDSGSGFTFYKRLCSQLCSDGNYIVYTSSGNSEYRDKLRGEVFDNLNSGDILILAFDCVGMASNFNVGEIIKLAREFCNGVNAELYSTTYYCFEELFLSYKYLCKLFKDGQYKRGDKDIWVFVLEYICNSIHNGSEYYIKSNKDVKFVIDNIPKAGRTKEKFAKAVLAHVSGSIYGDFKITDGYLGKCWVSSCNDVNIANKKYRCERCDFRGKSCSGKDKILELECNSMSALYLSFSSVIR